MMRPQGTVPVYLHREPVDFRLAIRGLSLMVEQELQLDAFAESLFVFINRQRNRIKILYWERNGFCLWYKRLEQERFKWPEPSETATLLLTVQELNWLLDGFDLWRNQPHKILKYQSVG